MRQLISLVTAMCLGLGPAPLSAQDACGIETAPEAALPNGMSLQDLVGRVTAKEAAVEQALRHYAVRESLIIDELGRNREPVGKLEQVMDIAPGPNGGRAYITVREPVSSLRTPLPSMNAHGGIQEQALPLLTAQSLEAQGLVYLGRRRLDETGTFLVAAKSGQCKGERCFRGEAWIDEQSFDVVKTRGCFPRRSESLKFLFETYREQIDRKFWFPTYAQGTSALHDGGSLRMTVKWQSYRAR